MAKPGNEAIGANEETGELFESGEILETGDLNEVNAVLAANRTILGDRQRIRQAGVIRPGIKIPVSSASSAQKALYEKLNAEGVDFDTIDAEMQKLVKGSAKSVLRPTNVDYFVVRDSDFARPADAQFIRETYADPDGKIRRIPIWFPNNDKSQSIPHNFAAFDGAHNIRCYSFYEGNKPLQFKYLPKDIKGAGNANDWRTLETDDEDEATKACGYKVQFGGRYHFYIKGVKSVGDIVLPTRSWYGLRDGVAVLDRVQTVFGRFNNTYQGESFLELVKVKMKVKTPEGKRQYQWVVTIETRVDLAELSEYNQNRSARGQVGITLINGQGRGRAVDSSVITAPTQPVKTIEPKAAAPSMSAGKTLETANTPASSPAETQKEKAATSNPAEQASPPVTEKRAVEEIISVPEPTELQKAMAGLKELAKQNGLSEAELAAYANFKLRKTLAEEDDFGRLQRLYVELRSRLEKDSVGVKAKCQELLAESADLDPEVEGMLVEFTRLAENNDIPVEQMKAHLTALTGKALTEITLEAMQGAYKEIESRLKRGNVAQFKAEVAANSREYKKAA
jgi:hypothetical protein